MHKYALLLNHLQASDVTQFVLQEIIRKPLDITVFLLNKEKIIPNGLPVFQIADFWGWRGATIVSSPETLEKIDAYPVAEPIVILGQSKDRLCVDSFNLDKIEEVVNEYYSRNS